MQVHRAARERVPFNGKTQRMRVQVGIQFRVQRAIPTSHRPSVQTQNTVQHLLATVTAVVTD